jgi:hypothetical protein
MTTINDIQFDENLFSQFHSLVVLLYQINEGVCLSIPLSYRDSLTFVKTFDDISACQHFLTTNDQTTITLFTYCENIQTWLYNNNPIPENVSEIIIFCSCPRDVQFYNYWIRRYTQKVTDVITINQLERQLLLIGMNYIKKLCLNLRDDDNTGQLLETYHERIPRSSSVRQNQSIPLNSNDFFATGFRSRFRRTNSGQFPSVSSISNEFLVEILRNLPEFFWRKLDRNPVVRKLSEFNGADRKLTEPIGFIAGKQKTIGSGGRNSEPGYI